MPLRDLVLAALKALTMADLLTVYALVAIAASEAKSRDRVTPVAVVRALEELMAQGLVTEYQEATVDLSRRVRKYVITDKGAALAGELPPGAAKVAAMRYATPPFYLLINHPDKADI